MAQYITIDSVASRYKTTKHSVYRWLRDQKDFPAPLVLPSGLKRWSVAELDAWDITHRASTDEYA